MSKMSSGIAAWKDIDWRKLTELNLKRLQSLMKAEGIDALFAHRSDNFQYVTGYMNPVNFGGGIFTVFRQGALVLAGEEQPIMLAGAADYHDARNFWWIDDVRPMPSEFDTWPKIITEALHDHGVEKGKIAVDPHSPYIFVENLKQDLSKSFDVVSAGVTFMKARSIKSSEEIKVMRRAAGLASAMVVAARGAVKEGVREIDAAVEAERVLTELEPLAWPCYRTVIMSGDHAAYLYRIPSEKIIGQGEIVNIDAGCFYMGYASEFSRHVMVGKPTEEQRKLYRIAFESEQEAVKAIKPGAKTSEIDRIARDIIENGGFGEYQHPHYTGHGHGIGLHDWPIVGDPGQKKEYVLEPGMVVAIEPGIFKPGVGGVRVEDVVLVTESGHEVLSKVGYEDKLLD